MGVLRHRSHFDSKGTWHFCTFLSVQAVDCFVGSYLFMPSEWLAQGQVPNLPASFFSQSFFVQLCSRFILQSKRIQKELIPHDPKVSESCYAEFQILFLCCQTQNTCFCGGRSVGLPWLCSFKAGGTSQVPPGAPKDISHRKVLGSLSLLLYLGFRKRRYPQIVLFKSV